MNILNAIFVIATTILQLCSSVYPIGVDYGTLGDNLPQPINVARFLKDKTTIDRVKLFDTNPEYIRAFAGTNISVTVTMPNGDIPKIRSQMDAKNWVDVNIAPYHPETKIAYVAIGNEVLHWGPLEAINNLVKAHKFISHAIVMAGIYDVKVSTPHSLGILLSSDPPSLASFQPGWDVGVLAPLLQFYEQTKAPFMVNPYPYFGYINLEMALFKPNPGYVDRVTGLKYTSTFDMLMDSVYSAMKKLGYGGVEIMVAETGWPSFGEAHLTHVNVANAVAYNAGLIKKVTSGEGTPLMPRKKFETYIFSLFNENQKPGAVAERNFGLFKPDLTPVYDVGLMKGGQGERKWCIAKTIVGDNSLQKNIDWLCRKGMDCNPTKPGGACFNPNTVRDHASYLMNSYFQANGRTELSCDFRGTGQVVTINPSKGACVYAG